MAFRKLSIDIDYSGRGVDILRTFVLPVMSESVEYDRITSFFSTDSLISIAEGLDSLCYRKGSMRLVLGLHDVPEDLAHAAQKAEDPTYYVITRIRRNILDGISSLSNQLFTNRLATIAWMIKDGLLSVKVAAPERLSIGSPGLFHNKVLIFRDEMNEVIAAVGSPNETGAGLGQNFEHLTAFTSWEQKRYTNAQTSFFERLWMDKQDGLRVYCLDSEFADEILEAVGRKGSSGKFNSLPEKSSIRRVIQAAVQMPSLSMVAGNHTALYPHQELAFLNGLSRWPIRLMLADEVGLGKTFEAGSILKYMMSHGDIDRILILAPKAVIHQWQDELSEHFNIDAWVFESGRRTFISSNKEVIVLGSDDPVLGRRTPRVTIISAQLARGTRKRGHIFREADILPDLLVVDEAHTARVNADLSGDERPTLMWKMLNAVVRRIPHLILATATPMQVHWREYHALLDLLGLPSDWANPENYQRSLDLTTRVRHIDLADAFLAGSLIKASLDSYKPLDLNLTEEEKAIVYHLQKNTILSVQVTIYLKNNWEVTRKLLIKVHPARFLTIRNTRTALKAIKYSFPKRNLPPFSLNIPSEIKEFYQQVETYLTESYFNVERELFPERKFSIGFVRCAYQQRLASSLSACRLSLKRRLDRVVSIESCVEGAINPELSIEDLDDSDVFVQDPPVELEYKNTKHANIPQAKNAAKIERVFLNDLIQLIDNVIETHGDPKMHSTIDLIRKHISVGDKVLVFSRYTDTLYAVIAAYKEAFSHTIPPYGIYTGPISQLDFGTGLARASRREIRAALDETAIKVVFCSDAASEGLNLQAARVIVNVDVPWNPARLEQRIGRIARLGQVANTVDVYNLWYPDSIEAKMYSRLMKRADLFELAVGEFPEVVGNAIRDQLAAKYGDPIESIDVIAELNALKNDKQIHALKSLWDMSLDGVTLTGRFRRELAELVISAAKDEGADVFQEGHIVRICTGTETTSFSIDPGRDNVLSLTHDSLRFLQSRGYSSPDRIGLLKRGVRPVFFTINEKPIDPTTIPKLIKDITSIYTEKDFADIRHLLLDRDGMLSSKWLPQHVALTIPIELECLLPNLPDYRFQSMSLSKFD